MLSKLTFVLCVILSVICVAVQAAPDHGSSLGALNTNAKRFRRGLPPLPPSSILKRKGGTPVAAAKRTKPSGVSGQTFTGNIKVTKTNGALVGYIRRSLNVFGMYTITTGTSNRATFSFTASQSDSSTEINIFDTSTDRDSTPYLGTAGQSSSGQKIADRSGVYVSIGGVAKTNGGAGPASGSRTVLGTNGGIESAIWKYNPTSHSITAQYINPDSSSPTTYIMFDPTTSFLDGGLFITGDPDNFKSDHPLAYEVKFTLV